MLLNEFISLVRIMIMACLNGSVVLTWIFYYLKLIIFKSYCGVILESDDDEDYEDYEDDYWINND